MVTGLAILGVCTVLSVVITVITWLSHRKRFEIDIGYSTTCGVAPVTSAPEPRKTAHAIGMEARKGRDSPARRLGGLTSFFLVDTTVARAEGQQGGDQSRLERRHDGLRGEWTV